MTGFRGGSSFAERLDTPWDGLTRNMLALAGTGQYRAEYGRPETPTEQAYCVLNGIGRYTTEWPLPDSKSSGGDTVGDHRQE